MWGKGLSQEGPEGSCSITIRGAPQRGNQSPEEIGPQGSPERVSDSLGLNSFFQLKLSKEKKMIINIMQSVLLLKYFFQCLKY